MPCRFWIVCLFSVFIFNGGFAQKQLSPNRYMVLFTDKFQNEFTISKPDNFLSERALLRRKRQSISIKDNDLPVTKYYVDSLKTLGFTIIQTSKWLNAALVEVFNTNLLDTLSTLSFVKYQQTATSKFISTINLKSKSETLDSAVIPVNNTYYGASFEQISVHNAISLHQQSFFGQGILIAILDGGFKGAPDFTSLTNLWAENRVILMRDIADPSGATFFSEMHGANVLSIMAGNYEGKLVGTAPLASYALIHTEVGPTEYPEEEFNWVVGAELADSIGADIINSSLGYSEFDEAKYNYTYSNMDGKTAICSQGAEIASQKGMVVVVSAGNEGNKPWFHITAPSDARGILCVGAMSPNKVLASFSSRGPSADGRVKPDVTSVGWGTVVETGSGVTTGNGTSFSAPVISGLTACLWQACPNKTNLEIIDAIKRSSNQYSNPDSLMGYGIPNYEKALQYLEPFYGTQRDNIVVSAERGSVLVMLKFGPVPLSTSEIKIYDISGKLIYSNLLETSIINVNIPEIRVKNLIPGIYILNINSGTKKLRTRFIKE